MTEATLERTYTGEMSEINQSGDTRIMWDSSNADEVAAARAAFDKLVTHGKHAAFAVKGSGKKGERITRFDPEAEKIILVPQIVGG